MPKYRWLSLIDVAVEIIFFLCVVLVLFSRAVMLNISHDEYQFVASGQLFNAHFLVPYRDYPYLHMPYMPFVNGILFFLTGRSLLAARLINSAFELGGMIFLFVAVKKVFGTGHRWMATCAAMSAVALLLFDPTFTQIDGRALNHALPELLSLAAFSFFLREDWHASSRKSGFLLLCGAALGAATGVRLSYAVMIVPFVLYVSVFPLSFSWTARIQHGLLVCLGALAGLAPAIGLFLVAPAKAYYGNLVYIRLNTIYRYLLHLATVFSIPDKAASFYHEVLTNSVGAVVYLVFCAVFIFLGVRFLRFSAKESSLIVLVGGVVGTMVLSGFAPNPTWPQYFFAAVPFMLIGISIGLAAIRPSYGWMVIIGMVIAIFPAARITIMPTADILFQPNRWITAQVSEFANLLRGAVPPGGRVLTLAPILPLEANLEVYPVFTVGPFSWRTAYLLSAAKREEYGVISPDDLEGYLSPEPPDAILTGPEENYDSFSISDKRGMETPFILYAQQHGYVPVTVPCRFYANDCTLWMKPVQ